jgi:mono/diheme cytochrome c family protein
VSRSTPLAVSCVALVAALTAAGCGQGKVSVPKQETSLHRGAVLFNQRCSGCHSLDAANAYGSRPTGNRYLKYSERTNGPNFNQRKEKMDDVLFAIRNGGFSGAIMPANIVVGRNAQLIASFVAQYSGGKRTGASK